MHGTLEKCGNLGYVWNLINVFNSNRNSYVDYNHDTLTCISKGQKITLSNRFNHFDNILWAPNLLNIKNVKNKTVALQNTNVKINLRLGKNCKIRIDRALIAKISKKFWKFNHQWTDNTINNWTKIEQITKQGLYVTDRHIEICTTPLSLWHCKRKQ